MTDPLAGHDRRSLLATLNGLAQTSSLTDADRSLLQFCFRASDHDIYFAAATSLGSWLPRDPALADWLASYCRSRDI